MGHPIIPNHTRFHDGTVYCDGGREVVRRLFHAFPGVQYDRDSNMESKEAKP
jgi:hypothetical protein